MGVLDQFSPAQRKALMIGAPVVGLFALIATLQKRSSQAQTTSTAAVTPQISIPASTAVLGTSQLSEFEDLVTGAIGQLSSQVGDLTQQQVPAATTPANPDLPKINSADWPLLSADNISQIGEAGPGIYTGTNAYGGAPEYALIGGQWQQNFNWRNLAPGTKIGIPTMLASAGYATGPQVTEKTT